MTDQEANPKDPEKKPNKAGGIGCLVAIIVVGALFYSCSQSTSSTPDDRPTITRPNGETIDEFLAEVVCEGEVKERLVSPATAKFGRANRIKTGNRWKIELTVDSQNSFGALLRSEWDCIIDGTDDTISVTQR